MDRRKLLATASVATLLLLAGLLRLPRTIDAEATFNADEAVNALVVKHWFEGEPTLFNWDATYYGVLEGALALPAVWLLGFEATAFRTVPVLAYLGFMLAVYVLGSRLYDRRTALLATGLLAAGSPMLILWSTLASGGYTLVILWGVLCLLQLEHLTRRTTIGQWFLLGVLVGFGLYIYELFLVFLPPLLVGLLLLLIRQARVPLAERARWVLALASGGLAGAALKFAPLLGSGRGTKAPSFDLAEFDVVRRNFRLLVYEAGPALFGVNPFAEPSVSPWVGFAGPYANRVGATLLIATLLIFFVVAVASVAQRWARLDTPAWLALVLQPLVVVAAFVVSRNATSVFSARYLLPAMAALTLVVAQLPALLDRLSRRAVRGGGLVASSATGGIAALGVVALVGSVSWSISAGDIGADLRPRHQQPPIRAVLADLEQRGIRGWLLRLLDLLPGHLPVGREDHSDSLRRLAALPGLRRQGRRARLESVDPERRQAVCARRIRDDAGGPRTPFRGAPIRCLLGLHLAGRKAPSRHDGL